MSNLRDPSSLTSVSLLSRIRADRRAVFHACLDASMDTLEAVRLWSHAFPIVLRFSCSCFLLLPCHSVFCLNSCMFTLVRGRGELWPHGTDGRSGLATSSVKPHGFAAITGAVPYHGFSSSFHLEHLLLGFPILVVTIAGVLAAAEEG